MPELLGAEVVSVEEADKMTFFSKSRGGSDVLVT